ncbi:hypothetical protein BH24BAC1_BH24BAC1_03800 [soil metagenome]
MRQLTLKVSQGKGKEVLQIAQQYEGENLIHIPLEGSDLVMVYLPNKTLDDFMRDIQEITEAEINFIPRGVITLSPPASEAPDQVRDVSIKSPIEIFLSGIQSVGSIKGLIGYAISAGVVVWIGLYAQTMYLLTASMLIAPFAGPAMNSAIATSSGEGSMLGKSIKRYFLALAITISTAALLSLAIQQEYATAMMVSVSQISEIAVMLPLIAGFAGALNLVQSERDSLVSGAAVGVLVAASLAPPAGVLGMSIAMANWQLAQSGLFLLLLQLVGINLSASLVFRLYGNVHVKGVRFQKGSKTVFWSSMSLSAVLLAALLFWQFNEPPVLQKTSIDTRVEKIIKNVLEEVEEVEVVEATARFTRGNAQGVEPIFCELNLIRKERGGSGLADEELKDRIANEISRRLKAENYNIQPVYDITLLRKGPK